MARGVWGYDASKKLVKLREGTNDMICLASNPDGEQFHVACYHKLLEPFMARGRELRAQGVKGRSGGHGSLQGDQERQARDAVGRRQRCTR